MTIEQFVSVFAGALDGVKPGELCADTAFKKLPTWDSLAILTVTDAIEVEFSVLLTKSDFAAAERIQDLYEVAKTKKG